MINIVDAYDYTDQLQDKLKFSGNVIEVSKEFNDIKDNAERVKFLEKLLEEYKLIPDPKEFKKPKNNEVSNNYRNEGNKFYKKRQYVQAFECYNKSLCYAEQNHENIGLAYANRSAIYRDMRLYKRALKNIELAAKNKYPQKSLDKLTSRKEACLNQMQFDVENISYEPMGQEYLKLSHEPNPDLPFISSCLEMKCDNQFGRYIITNKKLLPGEIIAIEEPFSKVLLPSSSYRYCANCLSHNFLDLLPCNGCTTTMFCSEECRENGMNKFHKFECCIIDALNAVYTKIMRIANHTFYEALFVYNSNIQQLASAMNENVDSAVTIYDFNLKSESDENKKKKKIFMAVDSLVTNEKQRSTADLFQRAGIVAIMSHLLLTNTSLNDVLKTDSDKDFYRRFIMKQTQIAALNYHGIFDGIVSMSQINDHIQYGSASFPFSSLINHSCAPNLVRVSYDCKNYMMVNRPINVGEQIFDNYGYHHCLDTLNQRQASLKSQYMFKCSCVACQHDYPLFPNLSSVVKNSVIPKQEEVAELQSMKLDVAKKVFKDYCKILAGFDEKNYYPCREISALQECLLQCYLLFKMTVFSLDLLREKL